jgi:hypothetical protein
MGSHSMARIGPRAAASHPSCTAPTATPTSRNGPSATLRPAVPTPTSQSPAPTRPEHRTASSGQSLWACTRDLVLLATQRCSLAASCRNRVKERSIDAAALSVRVTHACEPACIAHCLRRWKSLKPHDCTQDLVLRYRFTGWPVDAAGAPPQLHLIFRTWLDTSSVMLDFDYRGKRPTRFAEALWLSFRPEANIAKLGEMKMSKVDSWISPHEVVRGRHCALCRCRGARHAAAQAFAMHFY